MSELAWIACAAAAAALVGALPATIAAVVVGLRARAAALRTLHQEVIAEWRALAARLEDRVNTLQTQIAELYHRWAESERRCGQCETELRLLRERLGDLPGTE